MFLHLQFFGPISRKNLRLRLRNSSILVLIMLGLRSSPAREFARVIKEARSQLRTRYACLRKLHAYSAARSRCSYTRTRISFLSTFDLFDRKGRTKLMLVCSFDLRSSAKFLFDGPWPLAQAISLRTLKLDLDRFLFEMLR